MNKKLYFLFILIILPFFYPPFFNYLSTTIDKESKWILDNGLDFFLFAYEDLIFTYIAEQHVKGKSEKETLKNLGEYFAENITEDSASHAPDDELPALILGNGICSVQSVIAIRLLDKAGVKARIARSIHTYVEANIDGEWVIFEPFGGIIYTDRQGNYLTYQELFSQLTNDENFLEIFLGKYALQAFEGKQALISHIKRLYTPLDYISITDLYPKLSSLRNIHTEIKTLHFIRNMNKRLLNTFGKIYIKMMQFFYFKIMYKQLWTSYVSTYIEDDRKPESGFNKKFLLNLFSNQETLNTSELKESYALIKTRHYEILGRFAEAEEMYKNIFITTLNNYHKLYSLYYYGLLLYKTKRYNEALNQFNSIIKLDKLKEFKNNVILYFMGRCYEEMGNDETALAYYKVAFQNNNKNYSAFQFKRANMRASRIEKKKAIS